MSLVPIVPIVPLLPQLPGPPPQDLGNLPRIPLKYPPQNQTEEWLVLNSTGKARNETVPWWQPVLFAAMAGGMGWGIRGQYGHETGAMMAGLLVSLTLVLLLCRGQKPLALARAAAWGAVGMGIGGSMTYGQTVGLTHDAEFIGNLTALRWGMLGLAIKGGLWIGFGGLFLGMGLGGVRYSWREMLGLMLALVGAFYIGQQLLNSPFDPAAGKIPAIYFSNSWHWLPNAKDLEPREEYWGGLLFALVTALAYTRWCRKDGLAFRMGLWGVIGGMIGFPAGQSLQAFHAWHREAFQQGFWATLDPHMNWWNMMETTFGSIMGAALGFGLWLNRWRIRPAEESAARELGAAGEGILLAIHLPLLAAVEFMSIQAVDSVYDLGLIMAIIPITGIAGGLYWPYAVMFPIALLPIAGKTVRQLVYNESAISAGPGWLLYFIVPMLVAIAASLYCVRQAATVGKGRDFPRRALLLTAWMYFLLNYAFFRFPWPWAQWTYRTPNGIIFTVCVLGLTLLALMERRKAPAEAPAKAPAAE